MELERHTARGRRRIGDFCIARRGGKAGERAAPTNSPAAHVPLMWFLRWPGCTPKVPSKASIICGAVTSVLAADAPKANMGAVNVADARVRSANRALRRKE